VGRPFRLSAATTAFRATLGGRTRPEAGEEQETSTIGDEGGDGQMMVGNRRPWRSSGSVQILFGTMSWSQDGHGMTVASHP